MDVIVGFPTESKSAFNETYQVLQDLPWTKIHVFPYSERTGTRAAVLEETVPIAERKLRSQKLRALSQKRYEEMAVQQIHQVKKVLILKNKNGNQTKANLDLNPNGLQDISTEGLSRDYWPVQIQAIENESMGQLAESQEVTVKIQAVNREQQYALIGSMI
jgi:threonylcarbamoyladenosine tRNA methylthiotransferase MtaB